MTNISDPCEIVDKKSLERGPRNSVPKCLHRRRTLKHQPPGLRASSIEDHADARDGLGFRYSSLWLSQYAVMVACIPQIKRDMKAAAVSGLRKHPDRIP